MKGLPEERAIQLAQYIIEQDATVRQAAGGLPYPKAQYIRILASVWRRLAHRCISRSQVLERNKQERHIRGGMATKEKYEQLRKANEEK